MAVIKIAEMTCRDHSRSSNVIQFDRSHNNYIRFPIRPTVP